MVTISGFTERESRDSKKFFALTVQGGLETVLSEETGRYYLTSKQASVTSTFDEKTCQSLVGTKLPGKISRVKCDQFEYTIRETDEFIKLNHRWVYSPSEAPLDEMIYDREPVETVNEF